MAFDGSLNTICIYFFGLGLAAKGKALVGVNKTGAGFMNRRRLCQLTAAILTSDLTTHIHGFYEVTERLSRNYTAPR